MKPDQQPPEKLLEQLVANFAALCEADLRLKAVDQGLKAAQVRQEVARQRRDKATESHEKILSSTRRFRLLLLLLTCLIIIGLTTELLFPGWLSEQWEAFTSLIKRL